MNGRPVRGARVLAKRLGRAVDGFPEQSVTETDDRGEYRLAGLPPGQYKLEGGIAITSSVQVEGTMVAVTEPGDQIGGVQLTVPESRTEAGALRTLLVQGGAPVSARQPSARLPGGVMMPEPDLLERRPHRMNRWTRP